MSKKNKAFNAAYLIFGESLLSSLIQRQVLDVIINIRRQIMVEKYYLIVFLPWDQFVRKSLKNKEIINRLRDDQIMCKVVPVPTSVPVYSRKNGWKMKPAYDFFTALVILFMALPTVLFFIMFCNVRLFHSRGYTSSVPVFISKLLFGDISFIFDPRSDYPEEASLQREISPDNIKFRLWKCLERKYLESADAVITIGERFDQHFKDIYKNTSSVIIHNNVDTDKFLLNKEFRDTYRKDNGLEGKTIFCYAGSLNEKFWNEPEPYARFIMQCNILEGHDIAFLFLIPEYSREPLISTLRRHEIKMENCFIESPKFEDVPKYLSACDIGMYFLSYYSPRVGTKFVEYCSIGLATLVNENVGGATQLVDSYGLGCSLKNYGASERGSDTRTDSADAIRKIISGRTTYSKKCREFALNNFDNKVVVNKYSSVYKMLLNHK